MMSFFRQTALPLSALLLLGGCLDVPHPFSNPGKKPNSLQPTRPLPVGYSHPHGLSTPQ